MQRPVAIEQMFGAGLCIDEFVQASLACFGAGTSLEDGFVAHCFAPMVAYRGKQKCTKRTACDVRAIVQLSLQEMQEECLRAIVRELQLAYPLEVGEHHWAVVFAQLRQCLMR